MASLFLFIGVLFLLYGIAGAVMFFFKLVPFAFTTVEFQSHFYAGSLFEWSKYPPAFGGLGAGSWWKLILAGLFLILAGRAVRRDRKRLAAVRECPLKGGTRFCHVMLLILYPVISVLLIAPLHLRLLHNLDNPFAYIADFGITSIPGGQNYVYYNAVSILLLSAIFSFYFIRHWGKIMRLPAEARRMPGFVSLLLCIVAAQLSVLSLYPMFSVALPIILIVWLLSLFGGEERELTEEEKRKQKLEDACRHVQMVGSTSGLRSEEIILLQNGIRSGELNWEERNLKGALERGNLEPNADDKELYRMMR